MAVTISTILGQTYSTVRSVLTNVSTGLTDTQSPARTRTLWVLSAFPDEYGSDFPGYPVVTIEANSVTGLMSLGGSTKTATVTATIIVYNSNAANLDTLCDDVTNQIFVTGKSTLESGSLFSPHIDGTTTQTVFREKGKVHIRTMPVTFKWVG